jgi:zinc transport system ATP-binding protein
VSAVTPVVSLEHIYFSYNNHLILEDISLDIYDKDFMGLVGPNGSGKTTLLKIMLGLLRPVSGRVTVLGNAPQKIHREIGYVPHFLESDRGFPISVIDVVLMGRLSRLPSLGRYTHSDLDVAEEALRSVDLYELRTQRFGTLSQGQRQRVLIARALAAQPRLLILDEPTTSVDFQTEQCIYELLKELNKKITLILVSHDLSLISAYVTRLAFLNRRLVLHPGGEISLGTIEGLYGTPIRVVEHNRKF